MDDVLRRRFELESGRVVRVVSFRVADTYDGFDEARLGEEKQQTLEKRACEARQAARGGFLLLPMTPQNPEPRHLPPTFYMAELRSEPLALGMDASVLTVAWFGSDYAGAPARYLAGSVREIDWERWAMDVRYPDRPSWLR